MTTKQLFLALFSTTFFIASCQKNGEQQTVLTYSEVNVSWNYNPYPDKVFSVELDGESITDTLMYQSSVFKYNFATKRILGDKKSRQFKLKDVATGTVVLDTMVNISGQTKIRLLALSATDKPAFANDAEQPTDPLTRDSTKYSFIYNDPKLPDSILVKFYSGSEANLPSYDPVPFETVVMKRNDFSRYLSFSFKDFFSTVFYFSIQDAKTEVMIQDIDGNTLVGLCYGIYMSNLSAPTTFKFSKVLLRFADPDEPDEFRRNRFYDLLISETRW